MELKGRVWEERGLWITEIPYLNIRTESFRFKPPFVRVQQAITKFMANHFPIRNQAFRLFFRIYDKGRFGLVSNDDELLLSLGRKEQLRIDMSQGRIGSLPEYFNTLISALTFEERQGIYETRRMLEHMPH